MYITDGEAVPVLVYNPSDNSSEFYEISNRTLMWQGNRLQPVVANAIL